MSVVRRRWTAVGAVAVLGAAGAGLVAPVSAVAGSRPDVLVGGPVTAPGAPMPPGAVADASVGLEPVAPQDPPPAPAPAEAGPVVPPSSQSSSAQRVASPAPVPPPAPVRVAVPAPDSPDSADSPD